MHTHTILRKKITNIGSNYCAKATETLKGRHTVSKDRGTTVARDPVVTLRLRYSRNISTVPFDLNHRIF